MEYPQAFYKAAQALIEAGCFIDKKGWVPATSGNFSARLSSEQFAVTVSGKHKGRLCTDDIMMIDAMGHSLDGKQPSAETPLHTSLYRYFPQINAILHPHSANATVVSRVFKDRIVLENYELLKAFNGINTHACEIVIPIFENDQNIPRLAEKVEQYWQRQQLFFGYIITGHGLYTWGASVDEALRHLEALDFLFDCELRLHGAQKP